jgi:hypothetical protein
VGLWENAEPKQCETENQERCKNIPCCTLRRWPRRRGTTRSGSRAISTAELRCRERRVPIQTLSASAEHRGAYIYYRFIACSLLELPSSIAVVSDGERQGPSRWRSSAVEMMEDEEKPAERWLCRHGPNEHRGRLNGFVPAQCPLPSTVLRR